MSTSDHADNPIDRLPPQDTQAEEAVLGSLLMDPHAVWRVRPTLKPQDFYRERNGAIYECMLSLSDKGEPVDFVTISSELRACGRYDEVGGLVYLDHLVGIVPTPVHVEHYASKVTAAAFRRRLISTVGKVAGIAWDETLDLDIVREKTWSLLTSLEASRARNKPLSPDDQGALFWDMLREIEEDVRTTIRTGIADLDSITDGGFEKTDLIILMALPGMGKSAIGQSIGRFMGAQGHKVLFCSVEMSERQLVRRNAASLLGMDWHLFRRKWRKQHEDPDGGKSLREAVSRATEQMQAGRMHLWYMPAMTTADIRVQALEMKATEGLDCIVVDYLQILADGDMESRANRNETVGRMARMLKRIAGELEVPVLALSQVSRDYKARQDKRPVMSDARDSGEIEQHVDMLLGLYRDDFFYKGGGALNEKKQLVVPGAAELLVLKQRNGPVGTCYLRWMPELCEYVSPADEDGRPE